MVNCLFRTWLSLQGGFAFWLRVVALILGHCNFLHRSFLHNVHAEGFKLIASEPRIYYAQGWIPNVTASEVDQLVAHLDQDLLQSKVAHAGEVRLDIRRSRAAVVHPELAHENRIARDIRWRLPDELKISPAYFEYLWLQSYDTFEDGQPGFYKPHHDGEERLATLIVYLTEHGFNGGGETFFPYLDAEGLPKVLHPPIKDWSDWQAEFCMSHGSQADVLRIRPQPGDALLFFNHPVEAGMVDDVSHALEYRRATHGACPLVQGHPGTRRILQQWVAFKWADPRADPAAELSLRAGRGFLATRDLSIRHLSLEWRRPGETPCPPVEEPHSWPDNSSHSFCGARASKRNDSFSSAEDIGKVSETIRCACLDPFAAKRLVKRMGLTLSFTIPCTNTAPKHASVVLEVRLGNGFSWRVEARQVLKSKVCVVNATALDQSAKPAVFLGSATVSMPVKKKNWRSVIFIFHGRAAESRQDEATTLHVTNGSTRMILMVDSGSSKGGLPMKSHTTSSTNSKTDPSFVKADAISAEICIGRRGDGDSTVEFPVGELHLWSRQLHGDEIKLVKERSEGEAGFKP